MDSLDNQDALKGWAGLLGINLLDFEQVFQLGRANKTEFVKCLPEDTASLCFTSGTTGLPKGSFFYQI